jgi:hypothetical protein
MANPFREGGSLNIPTQDRTADYLFLKMGKMVSSTVWFRSTWVKPTWAN